MNRNQALTLVIAAANIVVMLLFPPFESVYAITQATIPTFEGFYFIFARHSDQVIVTTILYLETFLILINGALFWLLFREVKQKVLTPEEVYAEMMGMRNRAK